MSTLRVDLQSDACRLHQRAALGYRAQIASESQHGVRVHNKQESFLVHVRDLTVYW